MQLPTPRRNLIDSPIYLDKRERQHILFLLEIDAAFFELDIDEPIYRTSQGRRSVDAKIRGSIAFRCGQPILQIPATLCVTNQRHAGMPQSESAKLEMAM
jgi:hypothetical protein